MANKPSDCFDLDRVVNQIAASLSVAVGQVRATVELLDAGNTIPFIARYRKEVTQGNWMKSRFGRSRMRSAKLVS